MIIQARRVRISKVGLIYLLTTFINLIHYQNGKNKVFRIG